MYKVTSIQRFTGAALLLSALALGSAQHAAPVHAAQPPRASGGAFSTGAFGKTLVAVHGIQKADGRVTGDLEQQYLDVNVAVHGSVDSMRIFLTPSGAKGAVLSGVITDVQHGDGVTTDQMGVHEGDRFAVVVVDNGEGQKAPAPDQVSPVIYGPVGLDANTAPVLPLTNIDGGNYQVVGDPTAPPPGDTVS